ncbi:MAG: amidohydrolase [Acetobacteraceae bacterium]|nr:amidohydrolase [Acetobacteraceae bacterium]MSP29811.1 amidohydrolase [Acetobacteraceae bacterium]
MTTPTPYGRIFPPNKAWLAKLPPEEVLDPDLPIVDTHHHLWDRLSADLPQGAGGGSNRYFLDEFLEDLNSGHNTIATVFLQCHAMYRAHGPEEMKPVGETEFVAGIAAMSESGAYGKARVAAGIVGFADLTLGHRVQPVLEAHLRAGGGRFRGVRHSAAFEPDPIIGSSTDRPGFYLRPDFRQGLARLSAMGLSLDAWVFHAQIGDVVDLARAFPATNIIMGHCGGPLGYGPYTGKRDEVFSHWRKSIVELATCPNVTMKLGGMMMRLAAYDYLNLPAPPSSAEIARMWGPYIETCIEAFGPYRCIYESNFPVDKMGASWRTIWNAFKRISAGASADEKLALFSGNAQRVYRI